MIVNDYRIEAALRSLGKSVPRTPEKTVDDMVKTVRALNAEKQRRAGKTAPAAEAAAEKSKELTAVKKPKAPQAGMKK